MTVPQLRKALHAHRLDRAFSYEQLVAAIGPDRVTSGTLRRFIAGTGTPNELTVHAIRTYLARQEQTAVAS